MIETDPVHTLTSIPATDGVYMTYIQLSLLGVKAIVVQGDSLCEPYKLGYDEKRVFRTPAEMGVIG